MKNPVLFATVRLSSDDAGFDVYDIECRFSDGQKYAAVQVCGDQEGLAHAIAGWLNSEQYNEQH